MINNIYEEVKKDLINENRWHLIMLILQVAMAILVGGDSVRCFIEGKVVFGILYSSLAVACFWLIVNRLKLLEDNLKRKIGLLKLYGNFRLDNETEED
jgi:hypothetical protein